MASPLRSSDSLRPPLPRSVQVAAALGLAVVMLPVLALLARTNWADLPRALTSPAALTALWVSLKTAALATILAVLLGVPLAGVLARANGRLASIARAAVTLPLVLPPLVGGIALIYLLGRGSVLGDLLGHAGIRVPFTAAAVVLAQLFVAMPFLVISVEGAMRGARPGYDLVAATLGASRMRIWWWVTLPLVRPGLVSGIVLCFARALGEFGATALFAGNAPGATRTVPLAIYTAFNGSGLDTDAAVALSVMLIIVAAVILVALRGQRVRGMS